MRSGEFEKKDGDEFDNLQSTKCKDGNEGRLLPFGEKEAQQRWNRNGQDRKISGNMDGCIGEPESFGAQAKPRNRRVPELGNRDTVEKCTDDTPYPIDSKHSEHNLAGNAHAFCRKDSVILQKDCSLCAQKGGVIEGDRDPENLKAIHFRSACTP